MKIISSAQSLSNSQIRQNRNKIRQKLKLNLPAQEKNNQNQTITNTNCFLKKIPFTINKQKKFSDNFQNNIIEACFDDSYILMQKIGEGAHASVYKCLQKVTGKPYAVKITKQNDQQLVEDSKLQYKILKNLDHPNIMKAFAFYTNKLKMTTYLVCQLCDYPQLGIYLRNRNDNTISQSQATSIVLSLLKTLQYLHKNGVCHRDLKPENILYNPSTKTLKVIDFDCAKNKAKNQAKFQMWTKTGSLHYQAPQYFNSTVYSQKVDMWALGVIAYQLVLGSLPFKSTYYHRIIQMITQEQLNLQNLNISDDYKLLLQKLLQKDFLKRYSASECLRLPILLKNFENIKAKVQDDFHVNLLEISYSEPRSSKQIILRKKGQNNDPQDHYERKNIIKKTIFFIQT